MAISLTKNGNAVKFDFDDNSHYLNDGTIEVPVNSLTLVTDESNMFTFKKAASDDIFISGLYSEIGMSKAELIAWYKDNMVGSTGGSSSGVTEEWVEEYVSESISGKADTSDVQNVASDVASVSGDVNTLSGSVNSNHNAITALNGDVSSLSGQVETDEKVTATALVDLDNRKLDASAYTPTDLSNYYTKSQTNTQISNATDTLLDAGEFYEYTASNDERVGDIEDRLSEDEEVTSAALNELNEALSGKQDTLIAGSGITIDSANTISCTVEGGGKAIEAGRGIAITTGATADTVSFDFPIGNFSTSGGGFASYTINNLMFGTDAMPYGGTDAYTKSSNVLYGRCAKNNIFGGYNQLSGSTSTSSYSIGQNSSNFIVGGSNIIKLTSSTYSSGKNIILGNNNNITSGNQLEKIYLLGDNNTGSTSNTLIIGYYDKALNTYEIASGRFNNSVSGSSTFGDSGNTLFSVGNGTADNARHNAFEIRQNGDIYITSGGTDIKLQDNLGGGGLPESAFTAYTAATDARLTEDEEVTAAALNTLNDATAANTTALGGLKLVNLTQAQYDALATKDASTLYIITNNS